MFSERIIPVSVNTDLDDSLLPPQQSKFIKNLVYSLEDTSDASGAKGNTGVYKTLQNVEEYFPGFKLPAGYNHVIGAKSNKDSNEVFVFNYNDKGNHLIYRINGNSATIDRVYQGALLNFKLQPEYFIAPEGGATVTGIYVVNPANGQKVKRTFLQWTDGINPLGFICVEDAIRTNGFDQSLFPYFNGTYDRRFLIRAGVPTPRDCISFNELPLTDADKGLQNTFLFNAWQFRLQYRDVWGRPSEYGIISDQYTPGGGGNDCISTSSGLSRCLDMKFKAPPPQINQLEIAFRNCNTNDWKTIKVLDLYDGSPLGDWWLRPRNPAVNYDAQTGLISYTFCANAGCDPIDPAATSRLYNPIPKTVQSVANIGKFTAVGNNEDGYLPFSKTLLNAIKPTVIPPAQGGANNKIRKFSVYVAIYSEAYKANQPIYKKGISSVDDPSDSRYGWGANTTAQEYRSFFAYKQYFVNAAQKGFTGNLAGTEFYTTSKQYFLHTNGELVEILDFSKVGLSAFYITVNGRQVPDGTFLQKFEYTNVPKGKYILRLTNHQVDPAVDPNYKNTSTYVRGTYPFNRNNPARPIQYDSMISDTKEVVVDVCDGDYDGLNANSILLIADLTFNGSDIEQGYVLNTDDASAAKNGVELLIFEGGDGNKKSDRTDHNGFYFTASDFKKFTNRIRGYCNGSIVQLFDTFTTGNDNEAHPIQYKYLNKSSGCPSYELQKCNYVTITGKVVLCGTSTGVPGLSVVLSRGGYTTTDENGEYSIIAYDDTTNATRQDSLYFITNSCAFEDCNGGCIASIPITINKVFANCAPRNIEVPPMEVGFSAVRGLLSDSTRPIGVVGWDWLDRPTFVQPLGNVVTPSVIQTQTFAPSTLQISIDPAAVFPAETEYITFWVGEASGIQEYVTWIVDKVEFVDNSGEINTDSPSQIKIYYGSLVEYSKQNNYNTSVNWQFIPEGQNRPVLGDRVQFLLNGDGTFFPTPITAIVKYDTDGEYFLINYTNDLKGLQENAVIRLVRPKACITKAPYYEVCKVVEIKNRKAQENNFILNYYDTYYVSRQIPVPNYTDGDLVPSIRVLGVQFESPSPSDFWGYGCHNIGRINIENPDETVLYHEEQIALSSALSETGMLNYLNYFSDERKFNFDQTNINGITGIIPQTSTVLVLGQSDAFVVGFNDNIARVNEAGQVEAPSIPNQFGQPQNKIGSNYGCQIKDKSTISVREGLVHFLDSNRSMVVQHNYSQGAPISVNGAITLIREKCKSVNKYNQAAGNKRYFVGSINPINSEYLLTDFQIGSNDYINELRDYDASAQETHAFGIYSQVYRGCYGFTPQSYSYLDGDINDVQLFSFKDGQPYRHYKQNAAGYGLVYGVPVERVIRLVMSMDSLKKKLFQALAVYCKESMYFVDQALSETGQRTMILKHYFRQANYGWYAPVLCDLNTLPDPNRPAQTGVNKLLDGDMMDGTYLDVRFIGDPEMNQVLSKLHGFVINVIPQEPSGQNQ